MASSLSWIFYDSLSKTQSNPLSQEEAQMAIFKMKPKDWPRFFIWTQGWQNWQSLELFLKSEQKAFIVQFATSSPSVNEDTLRHRERNVMEMNSVDEKTHKEITGSYSGVIISEEDVTSEPMVGKTQFDGEEMDWSDVEKPAINFKKLTDKNFANRQPRHNLKIEILLISPKGKTFRTSSSNISLSGSLLEDNIPFDYYGINFDVVIVNRAAQSSVNARVPLKAKTVGEGLSRRISFHEVTSAQKRSLQGLLQDYLDEQEKLKKKAS